MAVLVSVQEAQRHVRADEGDAQAYMDLQSKLAQATAFVLQLCGPLADDTWDVNTVPGPVKTAILMQLAEIFTDRGDEQRTEPFGRHAALYLMSAGYRDPVLA